MMPNYLTSHDAERGFTLIESMVAMLVAAVVLLALGSMLIMTIRTNQQSEHRMDATAKAQSIMANLTARAKTLNYTQANAQAAAYQQLCSLGNTGVQGACLVGSRESIYTPTITLNSTPIAAGLVRVQIQVQLAWQEHGANKTVNLISQVVAP